MVNRLRVALLPVERAAARLPWADERAWRAETHVWSEGAPVINLHDLDVPLALDAVRIASAEVEAPALVFVVGRGRHQEGVRGDPRPDSPLASAVRDWLHEHARAMGHRLMVPRPGRVALVRDVRASPPEVTGRLSPWFWLGAFVFGGLVTLVVPPLGLLLLAALALAWNAERRQR